MSVHGIGRCMENCHIKCDTTGWQFRVDGIMVVGKIDSGPEDVDYELFTRQLTDLEKRPEGWSVSFPSKYRGQEGHYVEGARFMSVKRPDGRETHMEFTYRRLPWKFVRSVESRYEEVQQGQLRVPPDAPQGSQQQVTRKHDGQRQGQRRARRNRKSA